MAISAAIRERFITTATVGKHEIPLSGLRGDFRLYFDEPLDELAGDVLPLFDDLWTWLGRDRFSWWRHARMPRFERFKRRTFQAPQALLQRALPKQVGVFVAKGIAAGDVASPEQVADVSVSLRWYCRGGDFFGDAAAELRALDRWERMQEQPQEWLQRVLLFCDALPVKSGVAGFVAEQESLWGARMAAIFGAAMRHVGVDLDNGWSQSVAAPQAIKGVNWLTIIGRDGVVKLGGLDALRAALDGSVTVHETKHAIVLQAGPMPVAGDVNRNDDLPSYRCVYQAVKELQQPMIDAAIPFQMGRSDDADRTYAWLRRFDRPRSAAQ